MLIRTLSIAGFLVMLIICLISMHADAKSRKLKNEKILTFMFYIGAGCVIIACVIKIMVAFL